MDPIVIDVARATVVLLVVGGAGHVSGYLSGRRERQETQRQRVQLRRARRLDLKHRAPEPEEEQGTDTTVDVPVEGETASVDRPARSRFTGLVAGSSDPNARRHLAEDWHNQFNHIVELYGPAPDPKQEATPFFDEVSAALVQPTREWQLQRTNPENPPTEPGGAPVPKLLGQPRVPAAVLHAIAKGQPRPQDEMPTPMPKPSPAVAA